MRFLKISLLIVVIACALSLTGQALAESGHDLAEYDWRCYLDYADRWMVTEEKPQRGAEAE